MEVIATVKTIATAKLLVDKCPPTYFRANTSHFEIDTLKQFIADYAADPSLHSIPLYLDLQGAKLRVRRQQPPFTLQQGEIVSIKAIPEELPIPSAPGTGVIYITPHVLSLVKPGTHVDIDDGKLSIQVESVDQGQSVASCKVLKGGLLQPGKGFNLRPHPVTHTALSARDVTIVKATKDYDFVRYALSFASTPSEVSALHDLSGHRPVAVKLERELSKDETTAVCGAAGEVWICRGDMGVQLGGLGELAKWYLEFNRHVLPALLANKTRVVMAGEVLERMMEHAEPSRSEACHLADLWAAGYCGIVVSNETAMGKYPVEVITQFKEIVSKLK